AYPDIPSTAACDHTAAWCRDQAARTRTRIMYALAENQADPTLLVGSPLSRIPDLERFDRKEMTDLGRLQATALNKNLKDPTAFTPRFLTEMIRTLQANTNDEGYLNAFFNGVTPGSIGTLAHRLHQQHGGRLTPEDKKLVGEIATALAALSRKKNSHTAVTNALGPTGADMPSQALLVKLSAPNVKWSSAILADLAKAALRWRQKYPSYTITASSGILSGESHSSVTNQPNGRWWDAWGLNKSFGRDPDIKTLNEYDPALNALGRISQQKDLTAARAVASAELESEFTIKDADKAKPLTWLSRGNGGTYASLLVAPDWPDGGTTAGSVIALATTPEKGHEEEAATNAAELMKSVAWWNEKGRAKAHKLLDAGRIADYNPLASDSRGPSWFAHTGEEYFAEFDTGLRSGLLKMTRMYIPAIADANKTSSGTGLPNTDEATGGVYIQMGGAEMQQFLRTFALDDRAWTQLAVDTQAYRQKLLAWGLRHNNLNDAIVRSGYLEGTLIAGYNAERKEHEQLVNKQYEEAQKHLALLRDIGGSIAGSTPAGSIPGATDAYTMGTDLALEKVKYKDFNKNLERIDSKYATYSDQLYVDLAVALHMVKGTHTGNPTMDDNLLLAQITGYKNPALIQAVMEHNFAPPGERIVQNGRFIVSQMQANVNQNKPPQ
ncbi:hypothetical protein, partial [Actinomadura rubrisoli]|uniref:hypothetical protein n=1 Tax=Actinomadura rubrisoli TaxID=2530368 RepID=UPI00140474F3